MFFILLPMLIVFGIPALCIAFLAVKTFFQIIWHIIKVILGIDG